jgi:hypothetical protein
VRSTGSDCSHGLVMQRLSGNCKTGGSSRYDNAADGVSTKLISLRSVVWSVAGNENPDDGVAVVSDRMRPALRWRKANASRTAETPRLALRSFACVPVDAELTIVNDDVESICLGSPWGSKSFGGSQCL